MMNKEKNSFIVPDGYFEQLEQNILNKTIYSEKNKIIRISYFQKIMVAASILFIVTFSIFLYKEFIEKPANEISKEDEQIMNELYQNIYSENHLDNQLAELESDEFYLR